MRTVVAVNAADSREPTVFCSDGTAFRYRAHSYSYEPVITAQVPQPDSEPAAPEVPA